MSVINNHFFSICFSGFFWFFCNRVLIETFLRLVDEKKVENGIAPLSHFVLKGPRLILWQNLPIPTNLVLSVTDPLTGMALLQNQ